MRFPVRDSAGTLRLVLLGLDLSKQSMRVTFIRHGLSTGNIGIPCDDLSRVELTERGWQQAREVSDAWHGAPSLIVSSPYLRTHQTAQPTIERFPNVPVWPIQEFTYLEPRRWNGTMSAKRKPHVEAYWRAADPEFCDGEGSEGFWDSTSPGRGCTEAFGRSACGQSCSRLQPRSVHSGCQDKSSSGCPGL